MEKSLRFLEGKTEQQGYETVLKKIRNNLRTGEPQFKGVAGAEIRQLRERYSHFTDRVSDGYLISSTHVIHKLHPPKGWFHYLLNLKQEIRNIAVSVVGQDGAGVLSLDSVLFGSISKLNGNENYMHVSQVYRNTRNVWVKNEQGHVFCINPQPNFFHSNGKLDAEDYDAFFCEQGAGYSIIRSSRDGLESGFRIFVPESLPGEIWTVAVKNTSGEKRTIQLYPEINFGLDSHPGHYFVGMAVSEAVYYPEAYAILAKNLDIKNAFPRWGAFISGEEPLSFDTSGDSYHGFGAAVIYPAAVFQEKLSNNQAKQPLKGMVGVFQYRLELEPGECKEIHLALAAIEPADDVKQQIDSWKAMLNAGRAEVELAKVKQDWDHIFQSYLIQIPDPEINRTFNVWGKYQSILISRFNCPYDIGSRDIFQYLLANCIFEPGYVKLMLPYLLKYQYRNGRIPRQISKFSNLHDLRDFMDCQLWMHDLVVLYIKETGDFDILDETVGFLEEDYQTLSSEDGKPVYEHLLLAIKSVYEDNLGEHGLCKLGYGGWNDALDGLRGDKSQSVWLSELLVYAAQKMRELAVWRKDQAVLRYLEQLISQITAAINTSGWDPEGYYIFGYDNQGKPVGSSVNTEGKKHLNENSWAILSGIVPEERINSVIHAMNELKTPFGHKLLTPYSKMSAAAVGRIADQAKGHFENGSVYQHGAFFWARAMLSLDVDEAYASFLLLTNENRIPDVSSNPSIYHSNYTAIPENPDYGKEPYYPFSGSHAWRMRFLVDMLGIKAEMDHFCFNPSVPCRWRNGVQNGELIFKARKRSNRRKHYQVYIDMEVYRDDSRPGEKRILVAGSPLQPTGGQFKLAFDDPIFSNDKRGKKIVALKVYL